MRKIILIALVGLLGAGTWLGVNPAIVQAADPYAFSDGDGTSGDPYVVLTAEDLDHVRHYPDAYYVQGADIDLSGYADGTGWNPIGTLSDPFTGSYDGNHYTIEGLFIDSPDERVGLFGHVEATTLTRIRLENVNVTGGNYVGGLVGSVRYTRITYSSASGSVTGSQSVGGLIGYVARVGAGIQDSYAAVSVSGNETIGGLVGNIDLNTDGIERSYASGNVGGTINVGGLVGTSNGRILNSYATGNVHATTERAGGIVVNLHRNLESSFQTGTVTGNEVAGRLPASLVWNLYTSAGGSITNSFYNTSSGWSAVTVDDPGTGYLGLSDTAMRTSAAYGAGMDFTTIWGVNEGISYPYLRSFAPIVRVSPLAQAAYGSESVVTVNGAMIDGSMGEAVEVTYEIVDSTNTPVATGSQSYAAATGVNQGYSFSETLDDINYPDGVYTVNVTAEDAEGNRAPVRSVSFVADYTPPVITLNGDSSMDVEWGTSYIEAGYTASDNVDGDITGQVTVTGAVYTNQLGSYTLTYEVTDEAGNPDTQVRTVNVIDTVAPVITLNGDNPMQITEGSTFVDPWATAHDNVDGYLTGQITVGGTVDVNRAGRYSLTYSVQDSSGNRAVDVLRHVDVVRAGGGGSSPISQRSSNANLAQLKVLDRVSALSLTPAFDPAITEYTIETDADQVELLAVTADPKAMVKLQDETVTDAIRIPLVEGEQTINISVEAEDGTLKVYKLTITRSGSNLPESPACPFTDIERHWARAEICEAASLKIVEGVSASLFAPDNAVTRSEFAVMLLRTLRIPIVQQNAANPFNDRERIPEWARLAIHTGAAENILHGYEDGTFRPIQRINRAEMAAMLAKAMKWGVSEASGLPYSDAGTIPAWARSYVNAVHAKGLLQGRTGNQFAPNEETTRVEAAVVMLRLRKLLDEF